MQLRAVTALETSIGGVRMFNEDSALMASSPPESDETRVLLIVADGMGGRGDDGQSRGKRASELAVRTIAQTLRPFLERTDPEAAETELNPERMTTYLSAQLLKALTVTAATMYAPRAEAGSDFVCVLLWNDRLAVANNGGCRLYHFRQGQLHLVTNNRPWVSSGPDCAQILYGAQLGMSQQIQVNHWDEWDGQNQQFVYRANICSAVPTNMWTETVQAGDRLLLCSDGLWFVVDDAEIEQCLRKQLPPEQTVQDLIALPEKWNGGPDNTTVIVCNLLPAV